MASSIEFNPRLLVSVRDEPKRMLQPISGYEDELLLPIEEACKPLEVILDQELKQNVIIAKMNSTEPEDGLTQDESASIHLYTMEWKIRENSLYAVLNRTLRIADRGKLQPWFKYLKLFLTAFFKLPPTEHIGIWRGVPEDLSTLYPKGKELAWWGLSSCTSSISVLESPLYLGKSGARTMFSIQTNSGKLIRAHSYFQDEDEILLPPGRYFKVIDSLSPANGLHIIQIREIIPPYPLLVDPFDLKQVKKALPVPPQPLTPNKTHEKYSTSDAPKMSVPLPEQKKKIYPTADVAPKMSVPVPDQKKKIYSETSHALEMSVPVPAKKKEIYPTASVTPKVSSQAPSKEGKSEDLS